VTGKCNLSTGLKSETEKRSSMLPMLIPMLTNVVGGLCADAATNLAKEHVMDMVEKVVPPQAMAMVDQMVSADPNNPCNSMGELIDCMCDPDNHDVPALPAMPEMPNVDLTGAGPIELNCKVVIDPTTMDVSISRT